MPPGLAPSSLSVKYTSLEHLVRDKARGQRGKRKEGQSSGEGAQEGRKSEVCQR